MAKAVQPRESTFPLTLLALAVGSAFTMFGSFSVVQEAAKSELALSDTQLGLIQGLAVSLPIALLSIPIGHLVDRGSRVKLLSALGCIWTFGTILTAFAPSFWVLFIARMLAGLGATCSMSAAISIAADLSRPEARGRSLLILSIGRIIGSAAAFALAGWGVGWLSQRGPLVGLSPWRGVHLALGLLSAVLMMPLFALREPNRQEVHAGTQAAFSVIMTELWTRRLMLVPLFIGQVSVVMADAAAAIWASPVLSRSYGLQPDEFAGWMGLVIFGSGCVGTVAGAVLADAGQKRSAGGILVGAIGFSAIAVPASAFPIMATVPEFAIALSLLLLCGTATGLITATAITVLMPNELRGVCLGVFLAVSGVIGFGLAPPLVTWTSAVIGGEGSLAIALALIGTIVGIISFLAFVAAWRGGRSLLANAIG